MKCLLLVSSHSYIHGDQNIVLSDYLTIDSTKFPVQGNELPGK